MWSTHCWCSLLCMHLNKYETFSHNYAPIHMWRSATLLMATSPTHIHKSDVHSFRVATWSRSEMGTIFMVIFRWNCTFQYIYGLTTIYIYMIHVIYLERSILYHFITHVYIQYNKHILKCTCSHFISHTIYICLMHTTRMQSKWNAIEQYYNNIIIIFQSEGDLRQCFISFKTILNTKSCLSLSLFLHHFTIDSHHFIRHLWECIVIFSEYPNERDEIWELAPSIWNSCCKFTIFMNRYELHSHSGWRCAACSIKA